MCIDHRPTCSCVGGLRAVEMQEFMLSLGSNQTQNRRGEFISPRRACEAQQPYPSPHSPAASPGYEQERGKKIGVKHSICHIKILTTYMGSAKNSYSEVQYIVSWRWNCPVVINVSYQLIVDRVTLKLH